MVSRRFGGSLAERPAILRIPRRDQVRKALKLNSEAVPENKKGSEAAVKTLRALVTTIQSLAELRNQIGSGHGRTRRSPALTRHGRLAFNTSVALVEFLLDTWHVRRND